MRGLAGCEAPGPSCVPDTQRHGHAELSGPAPGQQARQPLPTEPAPSESGAVGPHAAQQRTPRATPVEAVEAVRVAAPYKGAALVVLARGAAVWLGPAEEQGPELAAPRPWGEPEGDGGARAWAEHVQWGVEWPPRVCRARQPSAAVRCVRGGGGRQRKIPSRVRQAARNVCLTPRRGICHHRLLYNTTAEAARGDAGRAALAGSVSAGMG